MAVLFGVRRAAFGVASSPVVGRALRAEIVAQLFARVNG